MTVKEFFKSTAFKSLAVLLCIVILAGGLLAIFNDVLYVSEDERFKRSIAKIYGGDSSATVSETLTVADEYKNNSSASVNQAYLMSDGNYLIQATGKGGYSNGTITVWVILDCTGSKASGNLKFTGIERVVYDSNDGQSFMNRFTDADYAQFAAHNTDLVAGKVFGDGGINVVKTGASAPFTFGALTAAVNATVNYFKATVLGVATEPDIYEYQSYIDLDNSEITPTVADKKVEYNLVMKKFGMSAAVHANVTVVEGKITAFATEGDLTTNDDGTFLSSIDASLKDGSFFTDKTLTDLQALVNDNGETNATLLQGASLSTGASNSSTVLIRAAIFALANYETCLYPILHEDWITADSCEITPTVADSKVEYDLVMKKYGMSAAAHINVTVVEGKITAFATEGDLTTSDDGTFLNSIDATLKNGSFFTDKTVEDLQALLNDKDETNATLLQGASLSTGASNSSTVLLRAAIFALANYETYLAKGGAQE